MSFLETPSFPLIISYSSEGGPEYLTEIVELFSGFEQRNARWEESKYAFNAASGVKTAADLYTLLQFFHVAGGKANGFRFKDWSDYKSCAPLNTIAASDQTIVADATGGQTTAQLIKTYTQGSSTRVRTIQKPVSGTIVLNKNGSAFVSGWTCDTTTGIITFSGAGLTLHDVITAGFTFDVPARFDTDKLSTRWEIYTAGEADVPIVGIRV